VRGNGPRGLLSSHVVALLQEQLPAVGQLTLAVITDEVPEYSTTLSGDLGRTIEGAISTALHMFLQVVDAADDDPDAHAPLESARRGAYDLGRGEARSGRTANALLAAYRIGARISWRELSSTAVAQGTPAEVLVKFAELVFAFIDELSAASVAGHTDELASSGRLQQQRRERLGRALITGVARETLDDLAEQAAWAVPKTLTAVVVPASRVHDALVQLDPRTLDVPGDVAEVAVAEPVHVLLVPDAVKTRGRLLEIVASRGASVGPARPWSDVAESLSLALRARDLLGAAGDATLDANDHLDALVVGADLGALRDLRERALAPLSGLTPASAERLTETLQAWLLHLGRRGEIAEALHIHAQTVRYRMTQLRELYGDALEDPATVQSLTIALALDPAISD
jgi:hypothetical protein